MTQLFADCAAQLAGFAARLFGWSPEVFWQATPAELCMIFRMDCSGGGAPLSRAELESLMEQDEHG